MRNKMSLVMGGIAAGMLTIFGCSKSNEDSLTNSNPPPVVCDTVNSMYTTDVKPILQANCYSCHGNGNAQGGINLNDYAGVKMQADNGKLLGSINHAPGYYPMPRGGAKLSECNINKIQNWVDRGAANN